MDRIASFFSLHLNVLIQRLSQNTQINEMSATVFQLFRAALGFAQPAKQTALSKAFSVKNKGSED